MASEELTPVGVPTAAQPAGEEAVVDDPNKPRKYAYLAPLTLERRFRAAYAAVSGVNGRYASYNDFRLAAMLQLAEQLERELNNGRPFEPAPDRFAPGRPMTQV